MRSALRRLLARPFTLQVLRSLLQTPDFPLAFTLVGNYYASYCKLQHTISRKSSDIALSEKEQDRNSVNRSTISWTPRNNKSTFTNKEEEIKPDGSWRHRLATLEQFQYTSGLDGSVDEWPRLLEHVKNFDIWLELIQFRRRRQGIEGIRPLFKYIQCKELQLPTHGNTADGLWEQFLHHGWETSRVWEDVIPYARKLQLVTGRSWPKLYLKILNHRLRYKPSTAFGWHEGLHRDFSPSSEQLKEIFEQVVMNDPGLAAFKSIYIDLPIRDMYATVIPRLCRLEKYGHAIKWHHLMMRMNDVPSSSAVAEPLLHYLAIYGNDKQLIEMTKGMVDAGVSFPGSIEQAYRSNSFISKEIINKRLAEIHGIPSKPFGDEVCARLFATTAFSIDMVVNGLHLLGIDSIGPLSLRELASRERSSPKAVCQRIDQLRNCGIALGSSTYSTLISSLASRGESELLKDVIDCDMHPDAFADRKLQESLLASYHQNGDHRQAKRTLAVLTVKVPAKDIDGVRWNLLLRSALKRKNRINLYQILDAMQEKGVPVCGRSSCYMRAQLLSVRNVSKRPQDTSELPTIIGIFQRILRTGGKVPTLEWREILRRLGMTGNLIEFEKLSIWLADWYSSSMFRASQSSVFSGNLEHLPRNLSTRHPRHPLRIIFPKMAQQAIIAWGFQHPGDIWNRTTKLRNKGLTWRWGIELLRQLRARKVSVRRSTVSRACKLRLIALFRDGKSKRKINRRARARNAHTVEYFAEEIERAWGENVFLLSNSLQRGDPRRFLPLKATVMKRACHFREKRLYLPHGDDDCSELSDDGEDHEPGYHDEERLEPFDDDLYHQFGQAEVQFASWYVQDKRHGSDSGSST